VAAIRREAGVPEKERVVIEALYGALKSGDPGGFVGNPMGGTKTLVDCSIDYISVARAIIDALEKMDSPPV
jgi:hypothetical protein